MKAIRRPVVWLPVVFGLLVGLVSMYMGGPPVADAARPSAASINQRITDLEDMADDFEARLDDLE